MGLDRQDRDGARPGHLNDLAVTSFAEISAEALVPLRAPRQRELEGLDISQQGEALQ
jgi:hypothetical protein